MLGNRWANTFTVTQDDIDFIVNHLLEEETPKTTRQLTRLLVDKRLQGQRARLAAEYADSKVYRPADSYQPGDRLVFTEMDLATAVVQDVRQGSNEQYGEFDVVQVAFDDDEFNLKDGLREFAAALKAEHQLNEVTEDGIANNDDLASPEDIMQAAGERLDDIVREALSESPTLRRLAGEWFPEDLVTEADLGTLHLSEAVLDMNGGGPLSTEGILEQIGGLGGGAQQLQMFSLNLALNDDDRFDEVGPAGHVKWFLKRMEPKFVQSQPSHLRYVPVEYDENDLSDEMFDLETELDDELTPIEFEGRLPKATSTLIYPHRRLGTLPLNAKNRMIFPHAKTPRIHVELVDTVSGNTYDGWVVHEHKYVYGLWDYYDEHQLPVGTYITVEPGEHPGQILISHEDYKARTEWVRLLKPSKNRISFENKKRPIGAKYDPLIAIGVDDLEAMDKLADSYKNKNLSTIVREVVHELSNLSPQGTAHAVTIYSGVNVVRRCPPGPIFALMTNRTDFVDVGDHYWQIFTGNDEPNV